MPSNVQGLGRALDPCANGATLGSIERIEIGRDREKRERDKRD